MYGMGYFGDFFFQLKPRMNVINLDLRKKNYLLKIKENTAKILFDSGNHDLPSFASYDIKNQRKTINVPSRAFWVP